MSAISETELLERRRDAADREFENYDFSDAPVEDANGWESSTADDEVTRVVFFKNVDGGDSIKGHFCVAFTEGSDRVVDVYASLNGQDVGMRGSAN